MAPSHYTYTDADVSLVRFRGIDLTAIVQAKILYDEFENNTFKITAISFRAQWVKDITILRR